MERLCLNLDIGSRLTFLGGSILGHFSYLWVEVFNSSLESVLFIKLTMNCSYYLVGEYRKVDNYSGPIEFSLNVYFGDKDNVFVIYSNLYNNPCSSSFLIKHIIIWFYPSLIHPFSIPSISFTPIARIATFFYSVYLLYSF